MNRKLCYPKIPNSRDFPLTECIAFEKYGGTNVHFCWHRDFGWHAFGTRRDEFNLDNLGESQFLAEHPELSDLRTLFDSSLAPSLDQVLSGVAESKQATEFVAFAEYLGESSFAGRHKATDPKRLVLFDVSCDGALLGPDEFVRTFGHLPIAKVVYRGKFTGAFADDVRRGRFGVVEGVICKAGRGGDDLHMAKIKTDTYLATLRAAFGSHWEQYWE